MEIDVSIHQAKGPVAVMRLKGEINATNFVTVSDRAYEIYQNSAKDLIIDLSEVTAISSAGMAALHKVALLYSGIPQSVQQGDNPDFTHSSNARRHVKLLNPQPDVEKSLEAAGMKLFFKIFKDLDGALASFQ